MRATSKTIDCSRPESTSACSRTTSTASTSSASCACATARPPRRRRRPSSCACSASSSAARATRCRSGSSSGRSSSGRSRGFYPGAKQDATLPDDWDPAAAGDYEAGRGRVRLRPAHCRPARPPAPGGRPHPPRGPLARAGGRAARDNAQCGRPGSAQRPSQAGGEAQCLSRSRSSSPSTPTRTPEASTRAQRSTSRARAGRRTSSRAARALRPPAPAREPDAGTLALTEAALTGEPPLVTLRASQGIRVDDVVDALVEQPRPGQAKRAKLKGYYQRLEQGFLEPGRVSPTVWAVVADLVGDEASHHTGWQPSKAAPSDAYFRADEPMPAAATPAQARRGGRRDRPALPWRGRLGLEPAANEPCGLFRLIRGLSFLGLSQALTTVGGERQAVPGPVTDPRAEALRRRYHALFGGEELPVPVESIAEDLLGLASTRTRSCRSRGCSSPESARSR